MEVSATRGNDPQKWTRLIEHLDERLQLGLLDRLRRITSYHFEDGTLFIEPGTPDDEAYLTKPAVAQQFRLLAQDATDITDIKIKPRNK